VGPDSVRGGGAKLIGLPKLGAVARVQELRTDKVIKNMLGMSPLASEPLA
jgi:hypothetical protein